MQPVRKAVILAAGFGTRFVPFSKAVSKTMLPIIDKPTIQMIVEEAEASGISDILIIVGANKESIINHFSENKLMAEKVENKPELKELLEKTNKPNIQFIEQKKLNGTAGAVKLAEDFVNGETFLMMYADDLMYNDEYPISKQIIDEYYRSDKSVLAVQSVPKEDVVKYSSVEYYANDDRSYSVSRIVEKPKFEDIKSTLSTLGRYVLTNDIFEHIDNIDKEINGEKYITDAFDTLARDKGVIAYEFDGTRYDIGNKLGYLKAVFDYSLRDKEYCYQLKDFLKEKNIFDNSND